MKLKLLLVFATLCMVKIESVDADTCDAFKKQDIKTFYLIIRNIKVQHIIRESEIERYEMTAQRCYNGCETVVNLYPSQLSDVGKILMTSFGTYKEKLVMLTGSNSTILSRNSIHILKAISKLSKLGKNERHLLNEYGLALPKILPEYTQILSKLTEYIGELESFLSDAIKDVNHANENTISEFLRMQSNHREKMDFKPLLKSVYVLINTLVLIAKTALNDCDNIPNHYLRAITIPVLISNQIFIGCLGTLATIASALHSESVEIPEALNKFITTLNPLVRGMSDCITSITNENVKGLLTCLADVTTTVNEESDRQFGFTGSVKITVEIIKQNLCQAN